MGVAAVTGAGGLIGRALTALLRAEGVEVRSELAGADTLFHLAAVPTDGGASTLETFEVNVRGTWEALDAAAGAVCVLASSAQVGAATPYAASKAAAEAVALAYGARAVRLPNVYGPGDRHASRLVPELVAAAREDRPPALRSSGETPVELMFVDDAARALLAAAAEPPGTVIRPEGTRTTVGEVTRLVAQLAAGEEPPPSALADGLRRTLDGV